MLDEVQLPAHVDVGEAAVEYGSKGAPYLQLRQPEGGGERCVHRQVYTITGKWQST